MPVRGKLDHEAAAAELRRYLDAVLGSTRFDLRYRIERHEAAAAAADLETPEIIVDFDGPDRELLLERGAELLKALEYIAVRWLRLDPPFHDRVRFDCDNYRATRFGELKAFRRGGRRARPRDSPAFPLQSHDGPRAPHHPFGIEGPARSAHDERRLGRGAPRGSLPCRIEIVPTAGTPAQSKRTIPDGASDRRRRGRPG